MVPARISTGAGMSARGGVVGGAAAGGLDPCVARVQSLPDLVGVVRVSLSLTACDQDARGCHSHESGHAERLEPLSAAGSHVVRIGPPGAGEHWQYRGMSPDTVPLAAAAHRTRTGDLWLFRGRTAADRLIQTLTNAPVNHVGVAVVLDDMPPLMWHAEMGRALTDVWTGSRQRGVQLHDLEAAVQQWTGPYGQRAWLRQLSPEVGAEHEDALLESVARLNGVSFPSTGSLTARWVRGRWAARGSESRARRAAAAGRDDDDDEAGPRRRWSPRRRRGGAAAPPISRVEAAYCAEVVGTTLEAMGVLLPAASSSWYDPGRFWSGDDLPLARGWSYGREIAVTTPETAQAR